MTSIRLSNVSLEYPVLESGASLVKGLGSSAKVGSSELTRNAGGRISSVVALSNVDLTIVEGERVALIGGNGSGKTTLLKVLAGIFPASLGQVHIDGRVDALLAVGIGMQGGATGRRNILLKGLASGRKPAEIEEALPRIIEFSELGEYIDLPVRTYSAGMAMRLAFSIASELSPEILLLDEWIGVGDRAFREKASERLRGLVQQAGIVVLASHNHYLLRQVCRRAIWLEHGHVRMDGPVNEVLKAFESE